MRKYGVQILVLKLSFLGLVSSVGKLKEAVGKLKEAVGKLKEAVEESISFKRFSHLQGTD